MRRAELTTSRTFAFIDHWPMHPLQSSTASRPIDNETASFPAGGGEMGALIRTYDWSKTSLGPLSGWPASLKTVTSMLLLSPVPIVLLWGEDGVMIYNDAYSVFAGGRHPQLLGSKVREGWPEVAEFNDNVMKVGLAGGTLAYRDQELTLYRHGKPEQVWMNLDYSPVLDEHARPVGVIAVVVETSERVRADAGLRDSEERFRALVTATSDVVYRMSADWKEMRQLDGRGFIRDMDTPSVAWLEEYLFPEDQPAVLEAIAEAIRRKSVFQLEHRIRRVDGTEGWTLSRAIPLFGKNREILEWFGAATDVTERRQTEEHLRLVINELNHRVKNNLAMMQAIAAQTFRGDDAVRQMRNNFTARLLALARANDLLTGERGPSASIATMVEQTIRPFMASQPARCVISGPQVRLSPKTALSFALAMHELSTNALKHGAWSNASGRVTVTWSVREVYGVRNLHFEWRESGGPPVEAPKQRGFGSRLIQTGLAAEMGGEARMTFEPEGFVCTIEAPLPSCE